MTNSWLQLCIVSKDQVSKTNTHQIVQIQMPKCNSIQKTSLGLSHFNKAHIYSLCRVWDPPVIMLLNSDTYFFGGALLCNSWTASFPYATVCIWKKKQKSLISYLCCRVFSAGRGDIPKEGIKLTRQLIRCRQRRIQVVCHGLDCRGKQHR